MPTWPTSASSPARNGGSSSTSTISTRRTGDPGSGTSSGSRRASSSPPARTAMPRPPVVTWPGSSPGNTGAGCGPMPGCGRCEVWYAAIPIESIIERVERARDRAYLDINIEEARSRDHMRALGKLTSKAPGGGWLIRDRPPLLLRLPDDDPGRAAVPILYAAYLRSLAPDRRVLVEKHRLLDVALKVVGVGSVGTRCYVALFAGPAGGPLILQVKEAARLRAGPLRPGAPPSPPGRAGRQRPADHAGRVGQLPGLDEVAGDRDGVLRPPAPRHEVRHRHRRPASGRGCGSTREVCAWALARAHARSGNPAEIAGYLGSGDVFDEAIASFAVGVRRPDRAGPRRARRRGPLREARRGDRRLSRSGATLRRGQLRASGHLGLPARSSHPLAMRVLSTAAGRSRQGESSGTTGEWVSGIRAAASDTTRVRRI